MYYLGIDGGGTRTTAIVTDENGVVLANETGDSINFNSIGLDSARRNMTKIIRKLTDIGFEQYKCAFIGMSAISERADSRETERFAGEIIPADKVIMDSDVYVALCSLRTTLPCAVTISGTGSMVAGRCSDGTIVHKGGWGHILGDEGSAYAIASDGLRAAARGFDGSGPETLLTEKLFNLCMTDSMDKVIKCFYNPPMERKKIARFSLKVFDAANENDAVAKEILNHQVTLLSETALSLLAAIHGCTVMGVWGGLFENHPEYLAAFKERINAQYPLLHVGLLELPAAHGAALAAIKEQ